VDELSCGEMFGLPLVDDPGFDEAGALVEPVAFALDDEEALFLGEAVDEALAEALDEVADLPEGAGLVQVGSGLGRTLFLPGSAEVELGLGLGLGLGELVGVAVEEPLALGLALLLGLPLALAEAEGLELAVPPLLWLALDDVTGGAVAVVVALLDGLVLVSVWDGLVDGDWQAPGVVLGATPAKVGTVSSSAEGRGAVVVWSPLAPAPLEELLMLRAEPMASPRFAKPCRAGGTTDRTTPRANTAAPMAKAGRSIASRQSRGRCGSRRRGAGRWDSGRPARPGIRRRTSPDANPEIASQTPSAPWGWLARARRDRILSRIRSRPSAPGST
jgi:hypothetical protein